MDNQQNEMQNVTEEYTPPVFGSADASPLTQAETTVETHQEQEVHREQVQEEVHAEQPLPKEEPTVETHRETIQETHVTPNTSIPTVADGFRNKPVEAVEQTPEQKHSHFVESVIAKNDNINTANPSESKEKTQAKVNQLYPTGQYDPNKKPEDLFLQSKVTIALPADTPSQVREQLLTRPLLKADEVTEEDKAFYETIQAGARLSPNYGVYQDAVEDNTRTYSQAVQGEDGASLEGFSPRVHAQSELKRKVTGEAAVMRMQTLSGLGGVFAFPLWHSGFWVSIKTPTDIDLLNLYEQTARRKTEVGRDAFGLPFSNDMTYIMEPVMELFEKCLVKVSLQSDKPTSEIINQIKLPDFQTICWGLARVIWPNGFMYSRSLLDENASGEKDRNIVALLDVGKLLWVDQNSLSDYQRRHMSSRMSKKLSEESVDLYLSQFNRPMTRRVKIHSTPTSDFYVTLHVPTIGEAIAAGNMWITNLQTMMQASIIEEDEVKRAAILKEYSQATRMCQYVHWVKAIHQVLPDGEEETYDDEESIYAIMRHFSSEEDMADTFLREVISFISTSNVSIVGVTTVKEDEEMKHDAYPRLIPVDAMLLFFFLLVQRAERIIQ